MKRDKKTKLRIGIVGDGKLAIHMGEMLTKSNQIPSAWFTRKKSKSQFNSTKTFGTSDIKKFADLCDVIFICISDSSISSFCKKLIPFAEKKLLIHCSGSTPLKAIPKGKHQRAVVYPLMTFTKGDKIKYSDIPFLVEAEEIEQLNIIRKITTGISKNIYLMNSEQRKKVHLAAVIASNFSNHLIDLSNQYLNKHGILAETLLQPLMKQTIKKAFRMGAHSAQTGPAMRGAKEILNEHLNMLKSDKDLSIIYKTISNSIRKNYDE